MKRRWFGAVVLKTSRTNSEDDREEIKRPDTKKNRSEEEVGCL